jgi:phosphoglycolate phosphatase
MTEATTAPQGIGGVVFDKDGTLFDFSLSWGGFTRRLIGTLASDDAHRSRLALALGYDLDTGSFDPASPVIADTAEEIADSLLPHLADTPRLALIAQLNDMVARAEMTEAVPLVPLFSALRARGLRIGLATNDVESAARAHLAAVGVVEMFDAVYGADSGHGAKPGPGMLLAFAQATGLQPDRVIMVGDSRHDLLAGRSAGMRTVAVLTGIASAEDLAPLADAVLRDIGDLPGWIDARHAG